MNLKTDVELIRDENNRVVRVEPVADSEPTLELMTVEWLRAPVDKRKAALKALTGIPHGKGFEDDRWVIRWQDAARLLSVTPRSVRNAVTACGIHPVFLTGSKRSLGIRATDLHRLMEGGAA